MNKSTNQRINESQISQGRRGVKRRLGERETWKKGGRIPILQISESTNLELTNPGLKKNKFRIFAF